MKILCVIDSLGSGGAQRQLVNLAIGFKERGHEVSFLVYHQEEFFKKTLEQNDIKVNEILESNYLYRLWKMRRFIRGGNYDAVLSFLEAANFICELAGLPWRNWKLIVGERSANPKILKSFKLIIYRWFHLFADFVVANSHENIKIVRKINPLLRKNKCKVIYNIVDFEKWKPDFEYEFRKNGKLNIIIVASHQYLKNLDGLIEAIALLSEYERSQIQINWYGGLSKDDSKDKGFEKIERLNLNNNFKFFEPTASINKEVIKADVLALFSFYEGLPNVVCEAMAAGKLVISSKVSDIPLLITDNRFSFNPNSINEISASIKSLLSINFKEYKIISNTNLHNASKIFDKEKIVDSYLELIH